ncbi:MAG: EtfB protein, partial [Pseudomonadota bacterium]
PIESISASDLDLNIQPRLTLLKVTEPPVRKAGIKVHSIEELLSKLRAHEGIQL